MTDIYMLVRKEFILFEPNDRIRLDISLKKPDGSVNELYIGGIMFDQDSGSLYVRLNDKDGYLVLPKQGAYSLSNLTTRQLIDVKQSVQKYVDKAMYRAKNINWISDVLDSVENNNIFFPGRTMPECIVDLRKDGNLEVTGFCKIFKSPEDGQILLTGANEEFGPFNYPLGDLTDNGVSCVSSCVAQVLSDKLDAEVREAMKEPEEVYRRWNDMRLNFHAKFGSSLDSLGFDDFSYPLGKNLFFEISKGIPVVTKRDDKNMIVDIFSMDIDLGYSNFDYQTDSHPLLNIPVCHPFEGIKRASIALDNLEQITASLNNVVNKSDKNVVKKVTSRKQNSGLNF